MVGVLVTGFGPFPGVARNPSGELLPALAGPGVRTLLLPVEYRAAADVLADALPRLRPDVALLFGVASTDSVVRIEAVARNHGSVGTPDVSGWVQGDRPLRDGAPDTYPASLPVEPLRAAVAASGRPVVASSDAGGYVCNATFYAALHVIATAGLPTRCGFVHVPGLAGWSPAEHEAIARICLETACTLH
jgi:pyroglutamyl-peptidase